MHVVFVHQNFPAQFGHVGAYLAKHKGFRCTFVTQRPPGTSDGIERIQYKLKGGATKATHYCSRTYENAVWHSHGVYEALEKRPDIRPDLIVAHSGFGSTIFLRELYDIPIINYFEYYYHSKGSDIDFRPEFPTMKINLLRSHTKNAMILQDLDNCDVGYSPTTWQRNRLPKLFHERVRVIFDGIDTAIWKPEANLPRVIGDKKIPDHLKVITYVSR